MKGLIPVVISLVAFTGARAFDQSYLLFPVFE